MDNVEGSVNGSVQGERAVERWSIEPFAHPSTLASGRKDGGVPPAVLHGDNNPFATLPWTQLAQRRRIERKTGGGGGTRASRLSLISLTQDINRVALCGDQFSAL